VYLVQGLARFEREAAHPDHDQSLEMKMQSYIDENKGLKDRLRDMSYRVETAEKSSVKQHELMVRYQKEVRVLEEKLRGSEQKITQLQSQQASAASDHNPAQLDQMSHQVEVR
jgi:hypothetical protein